MITTIFIFAVVLSVMVFAHEFGHFWTARRFGVKVEEFGFGLPPRIIGFQRINKRWRVIWGNRLTVDKEPTIYSVNWIPVGGFVKIKGQDGEQAEMTDSFGHKKIWQRVIILVAGVIMNVFLCMVLLTWGFKLGLPAVLEGEPQGAKITGRNIQVVQVLPDLPAQQAGIRVGDIIIAADGQPLADIGSSQQYLSDKADQTVNFLIRRGEEELSYDIKITEFDGNTGIGVALAETAIVSYSWPWAIIQGVKSTFIWLAAIVIAFYNLIKNLIFGLPTGADVAGPVGIAVLTGQFAELGFVYLLQFMALLSLNLAIVNILPFPALDGGRVVFLLLEKIRGRAVKREWENLIHNIGFILLMVLVLWLTLSDVLKYGGNMIAGVKNLFGL
ncbi:MAG TPA: M50 family metallopeptidase [bacterium]|nr:M50 family metallopeptidase [bacterium]HNS34054.1 M50 family metallopeptidase [bacterium]HNZ73100.1 M50 family metallopeptidase [bacterium]HOH67025.1 M50 family metallopeptidase [bacterium]